MNDSWKDYAGDFDAMTDEEIEKEVEQSQSVIADETSWVEAVASWKVAGKPRKPVVE